MGHAEGLGSLSGDFGVARWVALGPSGDFGSASGVVGVPLGTIRNIGDRLHCALNSIWHSVTAKSMALTDREETSGAFAGWAKRFLWTSATLGGLLRTHRSYWQIYGIVYVQYNNIINYSIMI